METLQSTIFIEFDVNTKKITFLRGDGIVDYDSNVTNVYIRVKYKNLSGNTVYLTPSELEDYKFSLYTMKPATNNVNVITGEVTDELKENVYGGVVKFEIPRVCTNRLGIVKCEIHINQGNKIIASSRFVLDVKQSLATVFDDALLEDSDFPVLQQLILEVQNAKNIDDNNRSKTTSYSSDKIENIKEDLSSQIKERAKQSDLEVERKRIDSFTSLAEGSTTGDAELIDARTDDLGVTHANVGEAFRRRAAKLNENIKIISDNVIGMSINLADISMENMTDGYYIDPSNGELLVYSNWSASDFIDIEPNTEYSVVFYLEEQNKYLRQDSVYYAVYNDSGVFISGGNTGAFASPTTINSGSGSKLKISCTNTRVNNGYMMLILTSDESKVLGKDKTSYVKSGLALGGLVKEELIKTKTELKTDVDGLKTDVDEKLSVPKIILPNEFYAVVGHELSIYNENVILCDDINRYSVDWYINQGNFYEQYNECFRITPKSGKEGDYNVICTIRDKFTYSILAQKTMTMHIVPEKTFINKNVLFIGDSRTSAGYYPYEIQTNLSNNGVTSLGTVVSKPWIENVQKSINHEGRGGWSAKDYVTQSSKGGYTNAFLNPNTNKFDFSYYMTQQGYTSVDAVFINLGTNGMITNKLDESIADNISAMNEMIRSIRSYSSTVPIIVELVTPPATQDGWTYANHGGSVWEMMFNIFRNNEKVIERYDGRKSEGIYLAPTIFNLDRNNDYGTTTMPLSARNPKEIVRQTNNVHPCDIGYYKMADVFWCLINALI